MFAGRVRDFAPSTHLRPVRVKSEGWIPDRHVSCVGIPDGFVRNPALSSGIGVRGAGVRARERERDWEGAGGESQGAAGGSLG